MLLLHATCVAIGGRGVLLRGPSGSGKSDLALRLIDASGRAHGEETLAARLVSDDQVRVRREGDRLYASAPPALAGLIEVRGLGIVRLDAAPETELALAVRLLPAAEIERLPEPRRVEILGVALPQVEIDAAAASAPARVRVALLCCA